MYALSPLTCYQQALDAGNYQADNAQYQAMQALEIIYCSLSERQLAKSSEGDGVVDWLRKKLGKPAKSVTPVTGLYMWGGGWAG